MNTIKLLSNRDQIVNTLQNVINCLDNNEHEPHTPKKWKKIYHYDCIGDLRDVLEKLKQI